MKYNRDIYNIERGSGNGEWQQEKILEGVQESDALGPSRDSNRDGFGHLLPRCSDEGHRRNQGCQRNLSAGGTFTGIEQNRPSPIHKFGRGNFYAFFSNFFI